MDILLTDDDITFTQDQDLLLVTGQDAIAQHILMRLRVWLGETPYDESEGVPYLQVIFKGTADLQATKFILTDNILRTPGVTGAELDPLVLDSATRELTVTGRATTIEGDVDFSLIVGSTP